MNTLPDRAGKYNVHRPAESRPAAVRITRAESGAGRLLLMRETVVCDHPGFIPFSILSSAF